MRNAKKMQGMWNPLIQGAKNLKLVVLEDKALMSEWLGGLIGGAVVVARHSTHLTALGAVPGKPMI